MNSIESIPRDVVSGVIAQKLPLQDLAALSLTSMTLHRKIATALEQAWNQLRADATIGPRDWQKIGVLCDAPALPDDIDEILKGECDHFKGKRVYQTSMLLLIPKGISIEGLGRLLRHLREGDHETVYKGLGMCSPAIFAHLTTPCNPESYWILITKELIPNSLNINFLAQKWLLRMDERPPNVLEAAALIGMYKERVGERLLPNELTRCNDFFSHGIFNSFHFVVGDFTTEGIRADSDFYESVGMLAVRPLPDPRKRSITAYLIQSLSKWLKLW